MRAEVHRLNKQIENLAFSITESASSSRALVAMIDQLERQKDDIQRQIDEAERLTRVVDVTEVDIRYHYRRAKGVIQLQSVAGDEAADKPVLERAVVYKEHVEIFLHVLPSFCRVNHDMFEKRTDKKINTSSFKNIEIKRREIMNNRIYYLRMKN